MAKKPTIAITGASGFLGKALVGHFTGLGWHVLALVRQPEKQPELPNVTYGHYDMTLPTTELDLSMADLLVHAAYIKLANDPQAAEANLEGARQLLKVARRDGIERLVFISTMSAHDAALSTYGKQKLAIERLFDNDTGAILKCGLIIGDGGIVKDMSDFMRSKHVVPLIDGGTQPLQIVALDDLLKVIEQVAVRGLTGSYVVATPQVYTYRQFYHALASHMKVKVLYVRVPFVVLRSAFKLASLLGVKLSVGEDNLMGLKTLRSMDSAGDMRRIGIELMDLDAALAARQVNR